MALTNVTSSVELGEDVGDFEVVDGAEAEGGGDLGCRRAIMTVSTAGVDGPTLGAVLVARIDGEGDVLELDGRLLGDGQVFLGLGDIVGKPDGDGGDVGAVFAEFLIEDFDEAADGDGPTCRLERRERRRALPACFAAKSISSPALSPEAAKTFSGSTLLPVLGPELVRAE